MENPFKRISKIDTLAQCPRCKQIWSYDGVDALLDFSTSQGSEPHGRPICRNCKVDARLYQEQRREPNG